MMVMDPYRFPTEDAGFNPQSDITWKALWWTGGTAFDAEGYSNTDEITTFPDEIGSADLSRQSGTGPTFTAANAAFNSKPTGTFSSDDGMNATLGSAVAQPFTLVLIAASTNTDANDRSVMGDSGLWIRSSSSGDGRLGIQGAIRGQPADSAGFNDDTDPHMLEFYADSTSSLIRSDGSDVGSTVDPGTNGLSTAFGLNTQGDTKYKPMGMVVALAGIYDGKFSDDAAYADFKAWVADHYGITLA